MGGMRSTETPTAIAGDFDDCAAHTPKVLVVVSDRIRLGRFAGFALKGGNVI